MDPHFWMSLKARGRVKSACCRRCHINAYMSISFSEGLWRPWCDSSHLNARARPTTTMDEDYSNSAQCSRAAAVAAAASQSRWKFTTVGGGVMNLGWIIWVSWQVLPTSTLSFALLLIHKRCTAGRYTQLHWRSPKTLSIFTQRHATPNRHEKLPV